MHIFDFCDVQSVSPLSEKHKFDKSSLGYSIVFGLEKTHVSFKNFDIAIIGIPISFNVKNKDCIKAPDEIRKELYCLKKSSPKIKILDLGNIKQGQNLNETYDRIEQIIGTLLKNKVLPIILGGSNNLLYSLYKPYEKELKLVNITSISSNLESIDNNNCIHEITQSKNNTLFNYCNIGYQSYLVSQPQIKLLNDLFFEGYRLGVVRNNIKEIEPILRDTDILGISVDSIKQSDAPGYCNSSPNGFYSEEICQIAWLAGQSENITTLGVFDLNPTYDNRAQSVKLFAQVLWYFIEGFYNRQNENPKINSSDYTKFHVNHNTLNNLEFSKSAKTNRWWLKLPYKTNDISNTHQYLSCSATDYKKASNNEIPDRIWKFYQKLL